MINFKKNNEKNSKLIFKNRLGQGMVEYALIIGLVAIICLMSVSTIGDSIYSLFFGEIKTTFVTLTNPK